MNNSKAHTTTTILTTTLALSCSLFALTAPAATWVEAGASASVLQARQSALSSGNNRFLPRHPQQSLQRSPHLRKWQYYKGVRVLGAEIIEHAKPAATVPPVTGLVVEGLTLKQLTPRLSKELALQTALDHYPDADRVEGAKVELVISVPGPQEKLAYLVNFMVHTPDGPKRPFLLLDAQSGVVLQEYDGLTHVEIGTGPGGNRKTGRYLYGTQYPKLDLTKKGSTCTLATPNVKTIDLNHGTAGSQAFSFTCSKNNYQAINGAYSPLNDAHFFGNLVYKMYQEWLNTAPLSFRLQMKVHYGNRYSNAFWDGSSMTFGDGGSQFYPLVALDVVSHEVSHGFTEQNSGLEYWGQSGGINEAFSDIAGEAAECYRSSKPDGSCEVDFLVGATIMKGQGALRYMSNPPQDGLSIDQAADYNDELDVHYSSGVYNKAFYLLANEPGWGVKNAFKVFAKANQNYWLSTTDFNSGACGVQYAAADLGLSIEAVRNSFQQVGVSCPLTAQVDTYSANLRQGEWVFYGPFTSVTGPLVAEMSGTGNADLYVLNGAFPSEESFDCRPFSRDSTERCSVPAADNIYVAVRGFSGTSSFKLAVSHYQP